MAQKNRSVLSLFRSLVLALAVGVGSLAFAPSARAQFMGMNGQMEIPLTSADIDRMTKLLSLNDDQLGQVKDLYQSFEQEFAAGRKQISEQMQEIMQEYQENRDPSVFQDITRKMVDFQQNTEKQQKSLYDDIRLLLDEKQAAEWPKFERRVKRHQVFRQAGQANIVSGASLDLVSIVEDQKLEGEQAAAVAAQLDQYETEMDRVVTAQKKLTEEQTKEYMDNMEQYSDFMANMDKFEKMFGDSRAMMVQVRDLNAKYSRQIAALLTDDSRAKFESAYNEGALPQVYRPSYVSKAFDTAKGMEDLSAEQKAQVDELKTTYQRELASANDKWAAAIRDWEVGMKMTDFWQAGSRPQALKDAQAARKELDTRTYEKLGALMTEEQREKLPKKATPRNGPGFGGD